MYNKIESIKSYNPIKSKFETNLIKIKRNRYQITLKFTYGAI